MLVFTVFTFIACVCADELGYKYRPVEHSTSELMLIPGSGGGRFSSPHSSVRSSGRFQLPPASYNVPVGFGGYQTEFYTFTAPEDVFDDQDDVQKIADSLKKKVRVIFIKNHENTAYEKAALSLIRQAAEQKTAIYVLNKQHDISDLAEQFNAVQNSIDRKPEVHFVRYRTPEDALNAQRAIQSQYDSLGGSEQSYNAGHAPVLNFASSAPKTFHGPFQTPNIEYLSPGLYPRFSV